MGNFRPRTIVVALVWACTGMLPTVGQDYLSDELSEVEGYLEPIKRIDVSTVETGIIESIQVKEGDIVSRGQTLVRLDREVLEKSLAVAKAESEAVGSLNTAKAELKLQENRFEILKNLFDKGHGRPSELERARADVEVARGRVLRAEEEILIRRRQMKQIEAKLAVRDIVSPIDGIVIEIHKDPGEAVSPNQPELVTVVDINQLKCVFDVPSKLASNLKSNMDVTLLSESHANIKGLIQWKSPIMNPDSETIKVIVRIDNSNRELISGHHCLLNLPKSFTHHKNVGGENQSVSLQKRRGNHHEEK